MISFVSYSISRKTVNERTQNSDQETAGVNKAVTRNENRKIVHSWIQFNINGVKAKDWKRD